mgnify:CR=1 FL=1
MNSLIKKFCTLALPLGSIIAQEVNVTIKEDQGIYSSPEFPAQYIKVPAATHKASDQAIKNWQAQRYGMFIHWGAYSVLGGIWKGKQIPHLGEQIQVVAKISGHDYLEHAVKKFNPVKFNAREYAKLAKAAGMKYIILTAKHHDGFCMFDSEHTDYDIMDASPYKKDIVKMFADACKAEGIKFGIYYSNPDWHHGHTMDETKFGVNERLNKKSPAYLLQKKQQGSYIQEAEQPI